MTGAVIEKLLGRDGFRQLHADGLKALCGDYDDHLTTGLRDIYAVVHDYRENIAC